MAIKDKVEKYF